MDSNSTSDKKMLRSDIDETEIDGTLDDSGTVGKYRDRNVIGDGVMPILNVEVEKMR